MTIGGVQLMEITTENRAACERFYSDEYRSLDGNGRAMLRNGHLQMSCVAEPNLDEFKHDGQVYNSLFNKRWPARFRSADSCEILRQNQAKAGTPTKIEC